MTIAGQSTRLKGARPAPGTLIGELALPVVLVALGVFTLVGISTMDVIGDSVPGPQFFPAIIAVLLLVTGGFMVIGVMRRWSGRTAGHADEPADAEPAADLKTLGIVVAGFVAFLVVLPVLGWLLSAAGLFFVIVRALGSRALVRDVLISLIFSATAQIAFSMGLGLNLPNGVIGVLSSWIS